MNQNLPAGFPEPGRSAGGCPDDWGRLLGAASGPPAPAGRPAARPAAPGAGRPSDVIQEALPRRRRPPAGVPPRTRRCRSSSGCGSCRPAAGSSSTGTTWAVQAARRRPRDLASTAARCPRRPRRRWPRSSWAGTPRPARRRSGPSGRSGSRRRSTASTRSTARSWPCGTSSS